MVEDDSRYETKPRCDKRAQDTYQSALFSPFVLSGAVEENQNG